MDWQHERGFLTRAKQARPLVNLGFILGVIFANSESAYAIEKTNMHEYVTMNPIDQLYPISHHVSDVIGASVTMSYRSSHGLRYHP